MSENSIDRLAKELTISVAHRISRRSFLSSLVKLIVAGSGATIFNALPVDRRIVEAHSNLNCTDWRWCNMTGYPCKCRGGSNTSCPCCGCNYGGTAWTGCCRSDVNGCLYTVTYYDCCGTCPQYSPGCDCYSVSQPLWCLSGGTYVCTLAIVGPRCGGCIPPVPPSNS